MRFDTQDIKQWEDSKVQYGYEVAKQSYEDFINGKADVLPSYIESEKDFLFQRLMIIESELKKRGLEEYNEWETLFI